MCVCMTWCVCVCVREGATSICGYKPLNFSGITLQIGAVGRQCGGFDWTVNACSWVGVVEDQKCVLVLSLMSKFCLALSDRVISSVS